MNFSIRIAVASCILFIGNTALAQDDGYVVKIPDGKFQNILRTFPVTRLNETPINTGLILATLADEAKKATKFKNIKMDSSGTNSKGVEGYTINLSSVGFDMNKSSLYVEYMALSYTNRDHFTKLRFEAPFQITKIGENFVVEIMPPDMGIVTAKSSIVPWALKPKLFGEWKLLVNNMNEEKHYVADFYNVYQALAKTKIQMTDVLTGEENSTYNPSSVKANFDRKLAKTGTQGNEGEAISAKYRLSAGVNQYPLSARFFPYQNGTKIAYSVDVGYQVNPDGSIDTSKEVFDQIRNEIKKVTND